MRKLLLIFVLSLTFCTPDTLLVFDDCGVVIYGHPTPGMVVEFDYRVLGQVMFMTDLYVDGKLVKSETMIALKGLNKFRYSGIVTENWYIVTTWTDGRGLNTWKYSNYDNDKRTQ